MKPNNRPIRVRFLPDLRARRGKLLAGDHPGVAVHAGSFLRAREIVLDGELLARPRELARILVHELYHFVWLRLDNATRGSFAALVAEEFRRGARGELGWSSQWRKEALTSADRLRGSRRWREYLGESFCDTAAWLFVGARRHEEFTLAAAFRTRRRAWFFGAQALRRISL